MALVIQYATAYVRRLNTTVFDNMLSNIRVDHTVSSARTDIDSLVEYIREGDIDSANLIISKYYFNRTTKHHSRLYKFLIQTP